MYILEIVGFILILKFFKEFEKERNLKNIIAKYIYLYIYFGNCWIYSYFKILFIKEFEKR